VNDGQRSLQTNHYIPQEHLPVRKLSGIFWGLANANLVP
jgi:hypothetical protein